MENSVFVLEITSSMEKSLICGEILNSLPNWFGNPEAIAEYVERVRELPLFAYKTGEKVLGFLSIELYDSETSEIIVMGFLQENHRQGIGRVLFDSCENYCLELGIHYLNVKTLADTHPSKSYAKTRAFYSAMGFRPQMILPDYWDEKNPCLCMIKALTQDVLYTIQMHTEHVDFVFEILSSEKNKAALHGGDTTLDDWRQLCMKNMADPDEANFIICRGAVPTAWLKVNGLLGNCAWISMLVVHERFQHQGVGSFAIRFAEDFVRQKKKTALGIHTTTDNTAAQNCYGKMGYTITEEGACTTGDGVQRRGYTFFRSMDEIHQLQ